MGPNQQKYLSLPTPQFCFFSLRTQTAGLTNSPATNPCRQRGLSFGNWPLGLSFHIIGCSRHRERGGGNVPPGPRSWWQLETTLSP